MDNQDIFGKTIVSDDDVDGFEADAVLIQARADMLASIKALFDPRMYLSVKSEDKAELSKVVVAASDALTLLERFMGNRGCLGDTIRK